VAKAPKDELEPAAVIPTLCRTFPRLTLRR
jgi:hypothetical protein